MPRALRLVPALLFVGCASSHVAAPSAPSSLASAPAAPGAPTAVAAPATGATSATKRAPREPPSDRTRRHARLAEIWGEVRFTHPYLFERDVDWDDALVRAIPKVAAATTEDEEAAAIGAMLATLGDPATRVEARDDAATPRFAPDPKTSSRVERGVVVVKIGALRTPMDQRAAVDAARAALAKAKRAVIDLRSSDYDLGYEAGTVVEDLAPALVAHDATVPVVRWVQHEGFVPQSGFSSGGYQTYFGTETARVYRATRDAHPERVAFVVDARSGVPPVAEAMQRAGDAVIVAQGDVIERAARWSERVALGEHHAVFLRRAVSADGATTLDARVPEEKGAVAPLEGGAAIDRAIDALSRPRAPRAKRAATPAVPRLVPDALYEGEAVPTREHRVLALFRFWNVIRLFYPHVALLDVPWRDTLEDFVPRFEAAETRRDYERAVATLAARVDDSHVWVQGTKELDPSGGALLPIRVKRVEGLPVVIGFRDAQATKDGFAIGDVLVAVGGEPFDARAARASEILAASNAWTRARDADRTAIECPAGPIDVRVRDVHDAERVIKSACASSFVEPTPSKPPYEKLDGGIGYVDLGRLQVDQVDAMFAALGDARAIVFDMRSYPNGTAWAIAPRLNAHDEPTIGALFAHVLVAPTGDDMTRTRVQFAQAIPRRDPAKKRYAGKTVMLIDERTQSQAEHTGLFFEAANGTRFVGSPTAGANGDTTQVCLPGSLCVSFTGHEVLHADGRPLQRVGLQPDVLVRPTLAGVRAGRDEVLEKALETLR